jgi:molecular chaperone GrpE
LSESLVTEEFIVAEQKELQNQEEETTVSGADPAGEEAHAADAGGAEPQPADTWPTDPEQLQQELEAARQEAGDNLDKALRAQAEMENLRKRVTRDIENAHKFALEGFVSELLPVLDSLELGLEAADSATGEADSLREGMDLTLKKFRAVLEKFGVTVIDPQGEKFDPERHEAVTMQELAGSASGTVVSVMQKGYDLNGRLVRPAMVIVAK